MAKSTLRQSTKWVQGRTINKFRIQNYSRRDKIWGSRKRSNKEDRSKHEIIVSKRRSIRLISQVSHIWNEWKDKIGFKISIRGA